MNRYVVRWAAASAAVVIAGSYVSKYDRIPFVVVAVAFGLFAAFSYTDRPWR